MNRNVKRLFAFFLAFIMLMSFSFVALGQDDENTDPEPINYLTVNGELFDGDLGKAVVAAGEGGLVGVYGRIDSKPLIYDDEESELAIISNVTIQGETEDATISIHPFFYDPDISGYDVFAIAGENVVIRDLLIDAMFKVDFPIRILPTASNISIENVVAKRGIKGAIGVFSSSNISIKNSQANDNTHSGFYFDSIADGDGVQIENCTTADNMYSGVLVRNALGAVLNLDLSGISCSENLFSIEDRLGGTLDGGERAEIKLAALPKNSEGQAISNSKALFFRIETEYQHIRYGISDHDILDSRAYIKTDRYGDNTEIYYKSLREAEGDQREGEELTKMSFFNMLINRIKKFIDIIRSLIYN